MRKKNESVPIGFIESAFGGTMIESWADSEMQLASCSNITCTANQGMHFTRSTQQKCFKSILTSGAQGAGANGQLYNGMVLPFVNITAKGFLWYQV